MVIVENLIFSFIQCCIHATRKQPIYKVKNLVNAGVLFPSRHQTWFGGFFTDSMKSAGSRSCDPTIHCFSPPPPTGDTERQLNPGLNWGNVDGSHGKDFKRHWNSLSTS